MQVAWRITKIKSHYFFCHYLPTWSSRGSSESEPLQKENVPYTIWMTWVEINIIFIIICHESLISMTTSCPLISCCCPQKIFYPISNQTLNLDTNLWKWICVKKKKYFLLGFITVFSVYCVLFIYYVFLWPCYCALLFFFTLCALVKHTSGSLCGKQKCCPWH